MTLRPDSKAWSFRHRPMRARPAPRCEQLHHHWMGLTCDRPPSHDGLHDGYLAWAEQRTTWR